MDLHGSDHLRGRRVVRAVVAAVAVCGLCSGAHAAHKAKPAKIKESRRAETRDIEALEEQWRAAIVSGDAATMDKLLADDFLAISARGTLLDKEQYLNRMTTHATRHQRHARRQADRGHLSLHQGVHARTGRHLAHDQL